MIAALRHGWDRFWLGMWPWHDVLMEDLSPGDEPVLRPGTGDGR